jgi:alpha-amylase
MQGRKPDERIRTPMQWADDLPAGGFSTGEPWEPLADDWRTVNLESDDADPFSLVGTYRSLIRLRDANPALAEGATWPVDGGAEPVIGWVRASGDDLLLMVVNVGTTAVSDYGLSLDEGPLCGVTGVEVLASLPSGGSMPVPVAPAITANGGLDDYAPFGSLPPRSGFVIRLTRS